ncbi:MAG: TatD family hydrolase, partial [Myxococcales bacterium]|nr:TatD family hydrolase [Myxococcales bacterium]
MIDSHCHLDDHNRRGKPAAEIMKRAADAGVEGFVVIGVGDALSEARQAIALAASHANVWATVGLHPHDAKVLDEPMLAELDALASADRVVAFGEIGLDYHYDSSPREAQRDVFRRMIAMAKAHRLPIVIHTREAAEDTLTILEEEGARDVGGIIHCFSEDVAFAKRALDMDFDVSFSGIVTFKNARSVQEVAAWAPLDRILIETDSPYLAPIPFRGKPCEPAMLPYTAARVAELRGLPVGELTAATVANTKRRLRL